MDRIRRPRRRGTLDPRRPHLVVLAVDVHLRAWLPRHRSGAGHRTGCCNHGAYFTDKDDQKRVRKFAKQLTRDDWQLFDEGPRDKGKLRSRRRSRTTTRAARRRARSTAPASSPTARIPAASAAPHGLALRMGMNPLETKPEVCWQLPVRREQDWVDRPGRHEDPALDDRGVRPPRLGRGRSRPGLVLHVLAGGALGRDRCTSRTAPS